MSEHLLFPSMYESFSLESLQSPDRSITLRAAIVHYQNEKKKKKKDLKALCFQRLSLLFTVFSRSQEWESSKIAIPLITFFFFSFFTRVKNIILGHYLMIMLIRQLPYNLTLCNLTYFLLQSIVSPVSSFHFPSKPNLF